MRRTALPELNQHVAVAIEGPPDFLDSRVVEVGESWLALALPAPDGRVEELADGATVHLQWITARGLGVATGVVRGLAHLGVEVAIVDLIGEPEIVQRRHHVRADASVRIVIMSETRAGGHQPAIGSTLDLAGGGIRARVPHWCTPGDRVRIRILLTDDEEVVAVARVVRRVDDKTVAFEFEELPVTERERIVRNVFRQLRAALATRER
ncbi:MAG: PilZ domain-containing protein [Gaiellales bacterium]